MALRLGTMLAYNEEEKKEKLSLSSMKEKVGKQKYSKSYINAPIDKFGVLGRWIRHKLLDGILVGTPVLLIIQKHRSPSLTTAMKILSFLGTEDFYTIALMCLIWLFDSRLGRLFAFLMWIGFYATGFLKSLLCLPRPPRPPVQPLEKTYDWALPSLHSVLGVVLPWYIWLYGTLHYDLTAFSMGIICTLIALWSFGVMLSRLYLGVHSPADIVCGGILGVIILSMWMQVDDYVDFYISQQRFEPQLKLILLMFVTLCVHPATEPGNPSFVDTVCVFGVISGMILGRSQRSRVLGMPVLLETMEDYTVAGFIKLAVLRFLLGAVIIQLTRIVMKIVFLFLFNHIYELLGLPHFNSSTYRKKMLPTSRHYSSEFIIPPISEGKVDDSISEVDHQATSEKLTVTSPKDDFMNDDMHHKSMKWYNVIQASNAIFSLISNPRKEPWDITIPTKYVTYTIICYLAYEWVPRVYFLLEI